MFVLLFTGKAATKKVPLSLVARLKCRYRTACAGTRILSSDAKLADRRRSPHTAFRTYVQATRDVYDLRRSTRRRLFAAVAADGAGP
jgi:hypothetical protein